jgi:phage terminase Nu1 subunit (DNA packaging protein)
MDELKVLSSRLQRELKAHIDQLNAEISRYPGPIARCDAQLGGLLEERSRLTRLSEALQEFEASAASAFS